MAEQVSSLEVTLPSDREIKIRRTFDAPRALVFEASTKPEYVKQWWGPNGTTLTRCEIDLRPGGEWRFVVAGADGVEHPFRGVYREIVAPERLVQTFVYDVPPFSDFEAVETATYTEQDGKTTITVVSLHQSVEARDGHLNSGMERGATETYDRLAALLAKLR
jgi:uncharacterized protein YndB with AHSA1/START domain